MRRKKAGIGNSFKKFCKKGKKIVEAVTGRMEIHLHLKFKNLK